MGVVIKNIKNVIRKSTVITPILIAATVMFATLFFYIPYITKKSLLRWLQRVV